MKSYQIPARGPGLEEGLKLTQPHIFFGPEILKVPYCLLEWIFGENQNLRMKSHEIPARAPGSPQVDSKPMILLCSVF